MTRHPIAHQFAIAFVVSSSLLLTSESAHAQVITVPAGYRVETVVTNLGITTTMAFLAHNDFLILEKDTGKVKRVRVGGPTPVITEVLTLEISHVTEQGLLGIAISPDFANDGLVVLYYTDAATPSENRIVRYRWDGESLVDPELLASLPGAVGIHNGGVLCFGLDGMLYAVIGDQNKSGPTQNDTTPTAVFTETGMVLRMNAHDGVGPVDNPFATIPGWERVFAYGIRNCFGLAVDPLTGHIWEAENGPSSLDEINRVPPGANCGWSKILGPDASDPQNVSDLYMAPGAIYNDPAYSFGAIVVPTGINFLHSLRWKAAIRDDCVVAMYGNNGFGVFDMNAARNGFVLPPALAWATGLANITDLEMGPDGYLYVVRRNGSVRRVRPIHPMGDINRDEFVNGRDVTPFVNVLMGTSTDPLQIEQADIDGDGAGDIDDLPMFIASQMLPN